MTQAIFAGGCFWCMEPPFERLEGVYRVEAGYTGGETPNPSYEEVSSGATHHVEAVRITFDPNRIAYETLLEVFWRQIDPTDAGGQFADRGAQYTTAIFYLDEQQKHAAEASKRTLERSERFDEPIVTRIEEAGPFYPAEEYHQDYYEKNTQHYKRYRRGSGREGFLERVWDDDTLDVDRPSQDTQKTGANDAAAYTRPPDSVVRERLSDLQYHVTRENGTEPPFRNAYWDNKEPGIYVDVVSGEPLFASVHKFASGTGWPSFYTPLVAQNVTEHTDRSHGMHRVEVRSAHADSHLGHVFDDGPAPTGLRYCINSAALRFIPAGKLEQEGYGRFDTLFTE